MKQTIFSLLIISAIGLASCRKDKVEPDIKQYDQAQIENYMTAHGLTGMHRDTTGGDTTGMYYQILNPGSGTALDYPDHIAFVYSIRALDGSYTSTDTISNHFYDYVGHINGDGFPLGLQTAVHNLLKYPGASMRVLIPSHLAYGAGGRGSGSSQVANNRIKGNESLDYYVHAISSFQTYDDQVIQNYMTANNFTGYTKAQSTTLPGNYYYFKVLTSATTTDPITLNSSIMATYTAQTYNATIIDQYNITGGTSFDISGLITGVQEGLIGNAVSGTKISLLIPSTLAYGVTPPSGVPPFSCLRFTWEIDGVTP